MFKTVILLLIITITLTASHQINSYNIDKRYWESLTPLQLAEQIANTQTQILKKIVLHYLSEKINDLTDTTSDKKIKQQIYQWFQKQNIKKISDNLHQFMKQKLFSKLEMQQLSTSFKIQIEKNPQAYFLTYDMYDLLID